jgi:hypothetical protein
MPPLIAYSIAAIFIVVLNRPLMTEQTAYFTTLCSFTAISAMCNRGSW